MLQTIGTGAGNRNIDHKVDIDLNGAPSLGSKRQPMKRDERGEVRRAGTTIIVKVIR